MSAPKKVKKKAISKANTQLPTLHPHAAGIDIGATEIQVAVPCDADPDPVRTFATFTDDLHTLRDWLLQCRVKTVAMESTSVYWIPVFQILEAATRSPAASTATGGRNISLSFSKPWIPGGIIKSSSANVTNRFSSRWPDSTARWI